MAGIDLSGANAVTSLFLHMASKNTASRLPAKHSETVRKCRHIAVRKNVKWRSNLKEVNNHVRDQVFETCS